MSKKAAQVIFECSDEFRKRLFEEKIKRRKSIKRMVAEALEEYWQSTPGSGEILSYDLGWAGPDDPDLAHWAGMFVQYIERCPPEKVKLLQSVIKADLKIHKTKLRTRRVKEKAKKETPRTR
jgi:hypothetical protein